MVTEEVFMSTELANEVLKIVEDLDESQLKLE